jgi:hypothetical protein
MKRQGTGNVLAEPPSASKEKVFDAIHDLVMCGHANLYPISGDGYWLRLTTGETFAFGQHGIFRIV